MITLLAISILILVVYSFVYKQTKFWVTRNVKQKGILRCFTSSYLSLFNGKGADTTITELYNEFPGTRFSGTYQFGAPILLLRDPDLIKQVTIKDFEYFHSRRVYIPEDIEPLFGKSLPALSGELWRNMRHTLSPAFTSSKMKAMFLLIKECAENCTKHFLAEDSDVTSVQFKELSAKFCSDVIATCAFGISVDSFAEPKNDFFTIGRNVTNLVKFSRVLKFSGYMLAPTLYRLLNIKFTDEEESAFFYNLVDDSIKLREANGIVRPDMIHLLMQTRKGAKIEEGDNEGDTGFASVKEVEIKTAKRLTDLSNEDITAQAFLFFFAGFESVSTLICFTAYELAVNTDCQDKLRAEIMETHKKSDGILTYESLVKMKYLDMVISEVLRKWPSQVTGERVCSKPYTIQPTTPEESTVHLDEGTVLLLPIFAIHRDPKYYPNPDRFDPERFSEQNKDNILPCSYIPFGAGPRNCIASRLAILETKILFYNMLLKFEIVPVEKTCIPVRLVKTPAVLLIENGCTLGLKIIK